MNTNYMGKKHFTEERVNDDKLLGTSMKLKVGVLNLLKIQSIACSDN